MKNAIKVFLVLYITLFISYSCQQEDSLASDTGKTDPIINSITRKPGHAERQDSIQHVRMQEFTSRRVFHNDISAGDLFVGY